MQASEFVPWTPSNAPKIPSDLDCKTYRRGYPCQRTTAIGRVTLNEPRSPKRIGVAIDGVQPLFRDYPRVGLSATANGSSVLDIMRNADGTGAFSLPEADGTNGRGAFSSPGFSPPESSPPEAGSTRSITLQDLWWWGGQGELTVSVFAKAPVSPTDPADVAWTFAICSAFAGASLTLEVSLVGTEPDTLFTFACHLSAEGYVGQPTPGETQVIDAPCLGGAAGGSPPSTAAPASIWVRLRISSSTSTDSVALSFADPAAGASGDHVTLRPPADSLVLVAADPPTNSEWRPQYAQSVHADIIFPRVGFNDFDRWLNNNELALEAKASTRNQPPTNDDLTRFCKFRAILMTAYVGRHLDGRLGPLVDSLPDLSVDQLLVELTLLDAL
jgi:hypothetical protein